MTSSSAATTPNTKSKALGTGTEENPWETAAVNDSFRKASFLNLGGPDNSNSDTTSRQPHSQPVPQSAAGWTTEYNASAAAARAEQCGVRTAQWFLQVWLVLDLMAAILVSVYAAELHRLIEPRPVTALGLIVALAVVLYVRCATAFVGQQCQRGWLMAVSANLSAVMAIAYMILSFTVGIALNWLHPHLVAAYLSAHDNLLLPVNVSAWLQRHAGKLWLATAVLCVVECARWQVVRSHASRLAQQRRDENDYDRRSNNNNNNNDWEGGDLSQSLLSRNSGSGGGERRWFRGWHTNQRSPRSASEEEDDNLFAAVQEEWASRTEEDPFWWSRDEEDIQRDLAQQQQQPSSLQWANAETHPRPADDSQNNAGDENC